MCFAQYMGLLVTDETVAHPLLPLFLHLAHVKGSIVVVRVSFSGRALSKDDHRTRCLSSVARQYSPFGYRSC